MACRDTTQSQQENEGMFVFVHTINRMPSPLPPSLPRLLVILLPVDPVPYRVMVLRLRPCIILSTPPPLAPLSAPPSRLLASGQPRTVPCRGPVDVFGGASSDKLRSLQRTPLQAYEAPRNRSHQGYGRGVLLYSDGRRHAGPNSG